MGQTLHPSATTTYRSRKEIQESEKTLKELASTMNISYNTVLKWKRREYVEDVRSGRKKGECSVLTPVEERIIYEVRAKTWMALDDLYVLLKPYFPLLSRSNLHRCLQRNGINRKTTSQNEIKKKKEFKKYEFAYVHLDLYNVKAGKEKHYSFVVVSHCSQADIIRCRKPAWGASFTNLTSRVVRSLRGISSRTSTLARYKKSRR